MVLLVKYQLLLKRKVYQHSVPGSIPFHNHHARIGNYNRPTEKTDAKMLLLLVVYYQPGGTDLRY